MVKNPFWQELTSRRNVQLWPLSSTHDSHETTSGQSSERAIGIFEGILRARKPLFEFVVC